MGWVLLEMTDALQPSSGYRRGLGRLLPILVGQRWTPEDHHPAFRISVSRSEFSLQQAHVYQVYLVHTLQFPYNKYKVFVAEVHLEAMSEIKRPKPLRKSSNSSVSSRASNVSFSEKVRRESTAKFDNFMKECRAAYLAVLSSTTEKITSIGELILGKNHSL